MTKFTYVDCEGETKKLDKFHMHEVIDRVHCLQNMLETFVLYHPASEYLMEEYVDAERALGALYQAAGMLAFNKDLEDSSE